MTAPTPVNSPPGWTSSELHQWMLSAQTRCIPSASPAANALYPARAASILVILTPLDQKPPTDGDSEILRPRCHSEKGSRLPHLGRCANLSARVGKPERAERDSAGSKSTSLRYQS